MVLKEDLGSVSIVDGKKVYKNWISPHHPQQVWNTREDGTLDISTRITSESLTQQQFKDECDINVIMKNYTETGTISHLRPSPGVYADLSQIGDLKTALDELHRASEAFNLLPAKVRTRFNNDPAELVAFCSDSKNLDEAIALGIAPPKSTSANAINANAGSTSGAPSVPSEPPKVS